jgi:hypothetical protein
MLADVLCIAQESGKEEKNVQISTRCQKSFILSFAFIGKKQSSEKRTFK